MYSVPMALVDYIPVVFFLMAAVLLQRDLYHKMSKGAFALFAAGTIDVFAAGFLKATYKLLYAAGVCDFQALSNLFFPLQSIGFVLAGVGILAMLVARQGNSVELKSFFPMPVALFVMLGAAPSGPAYFSGTMIFVVLMVAGLGIMDVCLATVACRMKKHGVAVWFIVSWLFSMAMGYLSSKDFAQAYMNWAAEAINVIGQGALFLGTLLLHRAGLKDAKVTK